MKLEKTNKQALPVPFVLLLFVALLPLSVVGQQRAFKEAPYDSLRSEAKFQYEPQPFVEKTDFSWLENLSQFFTVMLYLLVGIAVIGVIWLFVSRVLSRSSKTLAQETAEVPDETLPVADLKARWQNAKSQQDYRLATRYLFLLTLRFLDEARYIQIAPGKTNSEYEWEIKKESLRNRFGKLALMFDYVWYGEWPLSPEAFSSLEQQFTGFHQSIFPGT